MCRLLCRGWILLQGIWIGISALVYASERRRETSLEEPDEDTVRAGWSEADLRAK